MARRFEIIFEEYNIVPQVAFCFGEVLTKDIEKYNCGEVGDVLTYWQNWDRQLICVDSRSANELAECLFKKIKQYPKFGHRIVRDNIQVADQILKNTLRDFPKEFKKISSERLFRVYENFISRARKQFVAGNVPMIIEAIEPRFSGYMLEYLLGKTKSVTQANEVFSTLSYSLKYSPIKEEEIDFLKLSSDIFKYLYQSLPEDVVTAHKFLKKSPFLFKKLTRHYNKYFLLPYDFRGPFWQIDYFIKKLIDLKKNNINPKRELQKIYQKDDEIRRLQIKLNRKLRTDDKHRELFKVLQGFLFTKVYRKTHYTHSCYFHNQACEEIGRRIGMTKKQVWFLLPNEVRQVLLSGKRIDRNKIKERMTDSVIYSKNGKSRFLIGNDSKKLVNQINLVDYTVGTSEIRGQIAQPGKAKGLAKIILKIDDIKKMNDGDILVSIATNPDLLPAMKKAAAIVTEAGGITCHAAIVSRELGTPCVIGTKITTKVIKDGDLVEVDANKGVVKILKKA